MSNTPVFRKVLQIGLVVKSVEETAKRYWEDFGIGPWAFYTYDPSMVSDMRIRGKYGDYTMRIGGAKLGEIEFELIEPLDDKSIYAEHLKTVGEGIHHIYFDVADFDEARAYMREKDYPEMMSGSLGSVCPYVYFDTQRTLGFIAEIADPPKDWKGFPAPEKTYP